MNGAAVIQPAPIPFYTVLVLYLGIMAFIGWYAGRKTNNIGDFFVLSGKAGVVVSGIAYFSTQFSMGTFLGTPGTIYGVGYAGMAISVPGAVFCMILPALLIGRKLIKMCIRDRYICLEQRSSSEKNIDESVYKQHEVQ